MREPLFEVSIPDSMASLSAEYLSSDRSGPKLAVVLQVYDDAGQQKRVAAVCRILAKEAGVRLMTVENADEAIAPEPGETEVERLILTKSVSAGLCAVLNSGNTRIEVWGVDDMESISRSHLCMKRLSGLADRREESFRPIREWLGQLQDAVYPQPMARLRRMELKVYAQPGSLVEQAELLAESAQRLGAGLEDYPALARFLDMRDREREIDSRLAEQQKAEFLKRIMTRLHGWYERSGRNRVNIDLKKAAALLEFWMEKTNQTVAELERRLSAEGAEPVFLAMKEWYDAWVLEFAREQSGGGAHVFFEELMRFALRAEVAFFDLRDFRQAISLQRDIAMVKRRLAGELSDCTETLAARLGSGKAARFREIEGGIDCLYRALALGVPPEEAEKADIQAGALVALLSEAAELANSAVPQPVEQAAKAVDPGLDAASEFLSLSRRRGEHMVARTLELMEQRNEDRAVLVIGGFHCRAVTRALEDYSEVSWSVLTPGVDAHAASRRPGVL